MIEIKKLKADWLEVEPIIRGCHTAGPTRADALNAFFRVNGFTRNTATTVCNDVLIVRAWLHSIHDTPNVKKLDSFLKSYANY